MTVSTSTSRIEYAGNGVTVAFSVPFYFLANGDLKVYLNGTLKTITTHYTVTGAGVGAGGTVTFLSAPADGDEVVIFRDPAITQSVDYVTNDPFPANTHETALDRLAMIAQRLADRISRALHLADGDTSGASTELPAPEAGGLIGWNETGDELENYDPQDLVTFVTYGTTESDIFSGDGVTTEFTLSASPGALNNMDIAIDGVTQKPGDDYTWSSGTTLTFVSAPPSGTDNILVRYTRALPAADLDESGWTQSGTGAVERSIGERLRDVVSLADFGAVGDGVTDDTAAVNLVLAVGGSVYVPAGRYKTTLTALQLAGATFYGPGRILTTDSATERDRGNIIITMSEPPASFISGGSIFSDFDGEFLSPFNAQVYVSGEDTAGIPTDGGGYKQHAQSAPFFVRALFDSGQDISAVGGLDRTGWAVLRINVSHTGQGDAGMLAGSIFVDSVADNPDQWCQGQPAGFFYQGNVFANRNKVILNPLEYTMDDNGFDAVGKGLVINMDRSNRDEDEDQFWVGVRLQSIGSEPAGSAYQAIGAYDVLLDATGMTVTNAIALKEGQRVHFNADDIAQHKAAPQWTTGEVVSAGAYRWNSAKVYYTAAGGTCGVTAPTHSSGTVSDGSVSWEYIRADDFRSVAKTFTSPTYIEYASAVWRFVYAGVLRMAMTSSHVEFATRILATALATHVRSETASQSISAENSVVLIDATATNPTYTLPLAAAYASSRAGRITFKRTGAGGTVTIQRAGSDKIVDKSGTEVNDFTLASNEAVELVGDGSSKWHILYIA